MTSSFGTPIGSRPWPQGVEPIFSADGVVDGTDFTIWNAHKFTSAIANDKRDRQPNWQREWQQTPLDALFMQLAVARNS